MAENEPLLIKVGDEKTYWLDRALKAELQIATLTREREEAIARAERAELRVLELEEEVEVTSIELIQRADRAEAQLAEANKSHAADHAQMTALYEQACKEKVELRNQLDQARQEAERLRLVVSTCRLALREVMSEAKQGYTSEILAQETLEAIGEFAGG